MVDIIKLRDQLDITLKDYGVDWKIGEDDAGYYAALVEDLVVVVVRVVGK